MSAAPTVRHLVLAGCYRDSVALLALSSELAGLPGVEVASVVMGTPANLERLADSGLGGVPAGPGDVVVAVRALDEDAALAALERAQARVREPVGGSGPGDPAAIEPVRSLAAAVAADPAISLAVVSVPGDYAAAEATKALQLGLHVLLFSDNVPLADEVALKQQADRLGLLVMGPDCGTAIVAGVPLGFANEVRRGPVGVVGASGTGMQEVTTRLHRAGTGVSHALGVGGRDLSAAVGGRSTLAALEVLAGDTATEVIVLIAKPPDPEVAERVLRAATATGRPVVACLLGADPHRSVPAGVHAVSTLAAAADAAVALVAGRAPAYDEPAPAPLRRGTRAGTVVRGAFCGGTFAHEAELLLAAAGVPHEVVDYGDDEYTRGRPHPMIDPAVRDAAAAAALADPTTAVVVVDVVLGHGAGPDPLPGLLAAIGATPGGAPVVAHVCGTDDDPIPRRAVVAGLHAAGVAVAESNAEAVAWAAALADSAGVVT